MDATASDSGSRDRSNVLLFSKRLHLLTTSTKVNYMEDIKTNKMLVSVVLDRSGSMEETRAGTISGYNEYIKGLRADKKSEYNVTLMQFDSAGAASEPELTVSYEDKPLAKVPKLTAKTYEPRGMTPLYDAIGECARRLSRKNPKAGR